MIIFGTVRMIAYIRAIRPHTEADPIAILTQFLSGFGNLIGNRPHYLVGCTKHALKVNVVLVGATAKARKGLALGIVLDVLSKVDQGWAKDHIMSGLASGEGLIAAVSNGNANALTDKRLLITEEEFAAPLKVMARDGSILSPIIRKAWDSAELRNLTKNNPLIASDTHISIIGHITEKELAKYLTETEMANGFGNRFLYFCVKRTTLKPDGGSLQTIDLSPIIESITKASNFGKSLGRIPMDDEAKEVWEEIYRKLAISRPCMVRDMTERDEPYIVRLACIYAILDLSPVIRTEHLKAANAVWYCSEQTVVSIFGKTLGDTTADRILSALLSSPNGLSRTEISHQFKGHKPGFEINKALELLIQHGLAFFKVLHTGGCSEERWYTTAKKAEKAKYGAE